ncbi:NUMOD4 domain-containing protein [uncultured Anoxybacillus sp.]|uniref:NUMOD4 domain-containing protein n=1 Tax=uncultured Anoxybacillus sp. TaxID=263860 RepID=UPI002623687A|nr:NUMOD4 domain-containing protein [uncultured Anoxybacillus sp.]
MEVWKPVKGYEGVYSVSNLGRVRRESTGYILKPSVAKNGYLIVTLWYRNKGKSCYIHRILAEAFLPNPDPKVFRTINHKDGNKLNNDLSNLEWCSYSYNNLHAYKTGLKTVSEKMIQTIKKTASQRNKNNKFRAIPVVAYDVNGNFIGEFESITKASKELNINAHTICRFLKGMVKKPKMYVFEYQGGNLDGHNSISKESNCQKTKL